MGGDTVSTLWDAAGESWPVAMKPSGSLPVQSLHVFRLRAATDRRAVFAPTKNLAFARSESTAESMTGSF